VGNDVREIHSDFWFGNLKERYHLEGPDTSLWLLKGDKLFYFMR
jgi:hypothetical protein